MRAVGGIPNRPPPLTQLIPQLIRLREVLGGPSRLPFLHQLPSFLVGLSTLVWLSKGAEADQVEHLRRRLSRFFFEDRVEPVTPTELEAAHEEHHAVEGSEHAEEDRPAVTAGSAGD